MILRSHIHVFSDRVNALHVIFSELDRPVLVNPKKIIGAFTRRMCHITGENTRVVFFVTGVEAFPLHMGDQVVN